MHLSCLVLQMAAGDLELAHPLVCLFCFFKLTLVDLN